MVMKGAFRKCIEQALSASVCRLRTYSIHCLVLLPDKIEEVSTA